MDAGLPSRRSEVLWEKWVDAINESIASSYTYLNHKETITWAATGFYVSAAVLLGKYTAPEVSALASVLFAVTLTIFAFFILAFIQTQFELRRGASGLIAALIRSRTLLLTDRQILDIEPFLPDSWEIGTPPNRDLWPRFIADEIRKCAPEVSLRQTPWRTWLNPWRWRDIDGALRTEAASYLAVVFATAMAIALLILE